MIILEFISVALIIVGACFCVIGGLGLIRLPDFYTRTHGASITDTMGAMLLLIGLMGQGIILPEGAHGIQVDLKLGIIMVFLVMTSPTAGHALVKAAFARGIKADATVEEEDPS